MNVTRAGAHGLDLGRESSYSPDSEEDEDEAAVSHRLSWLSSTETVYAPTSGFTQAVGAEETFRP